MGFPQEPAQERTATVFQALSGLVPEDAIIPVDVGNNTYSNTPSTVIRFMPSR